jgi:hypothetical protein
VVASVFQQQFFGDFYGAFVTFVFLYVCVGVEIVKIAVLVVGSQN